MAETRPHGGIERKRIFVLVAAVAIVAAACGRSDGGEAQGPTDTGSATTQPVADACDGVELEATEIGVTADEIRIQGTADVVTLDSCAD